MKSYQVNLGTLLLGILLSCSTSKIGSEYTEKGHFRHLTMPEIPERTESTPEASLSKHFILIATNDMHGQIVPREQTPAQSSVGIASGGFLYLSSYLKILRQKFPQQVIYVDAGNSARAPIEENKKEDEENEENHFNVMNEIWQTLDADALNWTGRDCQTTSANDEDLPLRNALQQKIPLVVSNISPIVPNNEDITKASSPVKILERQGFKIGIAAVINSNQLNETTAKGMNNMLIHDPEQGVLQAISTFRQKKTNFNVLLMQMDWPCGENKAREECLQESSPIYEFVKWIPPGQIHAIVISGDGPDITTNIAGIPVIKSPGGGQFLGRLDFYLDAQTGTPLHEATQLYGAIQLCTEFFKKSEDCFTKNPVMDYSEKIPARFLGEEIKPDVMLKKKLANYIHRYLL